MADIKRWSVLLITLSLVLSGCCLFCNRPPTPPVQQMADFPEKGFQMFAAPRSSGGMPGLVFRIDREGKVLEVVNLNKDNSLNIDTREEAVGSVSKAGSADFNLGFLFGTKGNFNLTIGKTYNLSFKAGGVTRYVTEDWDIKPLLYRNGMELARNWVPGCRYYIIRETVSVKSISYKIGQDTLNNIGGEAKINALVQGSVGMKWNSTDEYQLTQEFDKPFLVFYKPERIIPEHDLFVNKQIRYGVQEARVPPTFKTLPVEEKLVWVEGKKGGE